MASGFEMPVALPLWAMRLPFHLLPKIVALCNVEVCSPASRKVIRPAREPTLRSHAKARKSANEVFLPPGLVNFTGHSISPIMSSTRCEQRATSPMFSTSKKARSRGCDQLFFSGIYSHVRSWEEAKAIRVLGAEISNVVTYEFRWTCVSRMPSAWLSHRGTTVVASEMLVQSNEILLEVTRSASSRGTSPDYLKIGWRPQH